MLLERQRKKKPFDFLGLLTGVGDTAGGFGGLLTGIKAVTASDARLKTDVETDHYDRAGHRWVTYRYKDDPVGTVRRGVIAQEVERTDPRAVLTDGTGVKFVDYRKLRGIGLADRAAAVGMGLSKPETTPPPRPGPVRNGGIGLAA